MVMLFLGFGVAMWEVLEDFAADAPGQRLGRKLDWESSAWRPKAESIRCTSSRSSRSPAIWTGARSSFTNSALWMLIVARR